MRRFRRFLIPVVAAGFVVGAYFAPKPTHEARPPSGVAVKQTTYACPTGPGITVASGQVVAGTASTATVLPDKSSAEALTDPKVWRTSPVEGKGLIVEQKGRSSGPVGFYASTAAKDAGGGLVVGSCPGIVDDAWFLGLGSGSKHFSTLILTNIADAPAAVDLQLRGSEGDIDAVGSKGIVIKPFTTQRIEVNALAAGEPELALRVLRRRGSVTAVVEDRSTAVFGGTEHVSATLSPRRTQVIGGVVSGESGRSLALLNPGTTTARVEVDVIGPANTFRPAGLESLKVKAGTLQLVDVPVTTGGDRLALRITSDVPIAATVRMAPEKADYAYAESALALAGPAVVPVELGKGVGAPDLIVTAPHKAASVQVLAFDKDMKQLEEVDLAVGAGTTQHLDTAKAFKQKGIAYFVVRHKGEIVAAATYRDGDRISSMPLASAPVTVLAPQVRPVD